MLPDPDVETTSAGGLVTASEALAGGLTRADIARAVRQGRWLRLERGVFVPSETWEGLDARGRHLALAQARLLVLGPAWALARRTAVVGHGLSHLGVQPTVPQLLGAKGRAKARSRHERIATLPVEDVALLEGFRATSLERTVVDVCRKETFRGAVVIADSALRSGADLAVACAVGGRCEGWPGGSGIAPVLRFADGRAETPLESISRVAMLWCGLPAPELQVEVYRGRQLLGRVDFLWRAYNLVGECDGLVKYTDTDTVVREKLREEGLTSHGLEVVRWNWDHAWRSEEMERRIRRGMAQGQGRQCDPELRFVSTTVPAFPAAV
ncbi:MAG: hypothetical protein JWO27_659 [Frankiales bacterium]|nr:hypothetical protein [Frankiales bacterium]